MTSFVMSTSSSHHALRDPVSTMTGLTAYITGTFTVIASGVRSIDYGLYSTLTFAISGVLLTIAIGTYSKFRRAKLGLDIEEAAIRARSLVEVDLITKRSLTRQMKSLKEELRYMQMRLNESHSTNTNLFHVIEQLERQINHANKDIRHNSQDIRKLTDSHPEMPVVRIEVKPAEASILNIIDKEGDSTPMINALRKGTSEQ